MVAFFSTKSDDRFLDGAKVNQSSTQMPGFWSRNFGIVLIRDIHYILFHSGGEGLLGLTVAESSSGEPLRLAPAPQLVFNFSDVFERTKPVLGFCFGVTSDGEEHVLHLFTDQRLALQQNCEAVLGVSSLDFRTVRDVGVSR